MSCCDEQPTRPERAGLRPSSESSSYHARTRKMTMFSCNLCITLSSRDQNNVKSDLLLSHHPPSREDHGHRSGCCCCSTQRVHTVTGPPSTGAAITTCMDGGVADTTRGNIDHSGNTPGRSSAKRGGREGAVLGPGPHALNAASGKRGVTPQKRMIACGETR